ANKNAGDESVRDLEKIFADPEANERQLLQASLLQIGISTADHPAAHQAQTAAWARLTKLAQGKSAVALDALTILAQRELSTPNESTGGTSSRPSSAPVPPSDVGAALDAHPLAKAPHKLLAVDLRIHASPNEKAALIQS